MPSNAIDFNFQYFIESHSTCKHNCHVEQVDVMNLQFFISKHFYQFIVHLCVLGIPLYFLLFLKFSMVT